MSGQKALQGAKTETKELLGGNWREKCFSDEGHWFFLPIRPPNSGYTWTTHRSQPLLHIIKILPQLLHLKYILVENVKGFETSTAYSLLIECLQQIGFDWRTFLISPTQLGVPNSRLRCYIVARSSKLPPFSQVYSSFKILEFSLMKFQALHWFSKKYFNFPFEYYLRQLDRWVVNRCF